VYHTVCTSAAGMKLMQSKLNLFLETGETYKEQLRGTIGYMSPELILTGGLLLYLCVYARVCTYDSCSAFYGSRYDASVSREPYQHPRKTFNMWWCVYFSCLKRFCGPLVRLLLTRFLLVQQTHRGAFYLPRTLCMTA
jgi:hypothetical protein